MLMTMLLSSSSSKSPNLIKSSGIKRFGFFPPNRTWRGNLKAASSLCRSFDWCRHIGRRPSDRQRWCRLQIKPWSVSRACRTAALSFWCLIPGLYRHHKLRCNPHNFIVSIGKRSSIRSCNSIKPVRWPDVWSFWRPFQLSHSSGVMGLSLVGGGVVIFFD